MAVAQRTSALIQNYPSRQEGTRDFAPQEASARRHVRVQEPQIGLFVRKLVFAAIPLLAVLAVVYGRMEHLQATIQRTHLNRSVRQELGKLRALQSDMQQVRMLDQIDTFAKSNGLVMQASAPVFIGANQRDR